MLFQSTMSAGPTQAPLLLMTSEPSMLMVLASTSPPSMLSALLARNAQGTAATSWRGDSAVPSTEISSHREAPLNKASSSGVSSPRLTV